MQAFPSPPKLSTIDGRFWAARKTKGRGFRDDHHPESADQPSRLADSNFDSLKSDDGLGPQCSLLGFVEGPPFTLLWLCEVTTSFAHYILKPGVRRPPKRSEFEVPTEEVLKSAELKVGNFANCLVEARSELQHKYVLNYFVEAKFVHYDLHLRKPGVRRPPKRSEFEVPTEEVLKSAELKVGNFANCLVEARSELQHKSNTPKFEEVCGGKEDTWRGSVMKPVNPVANLVFSFVDQ
ncbi:hypothetical protein CFP56_018982 [Quercus suber]|uniref:Uncharacterized protein n=1 Tax=Quercus suber TaxID=58331 RepID=A0AAW0KJY6_QUESU